MRTLENIETLLPLGGTRGHNYTRRGDIFGRYLIDHFKRKSTVWRRKQDQTGNNSKDTLKSHRGNTCKKAKQCRCQEGSFWKRLGFLFADDFFFFCHVSKTEVIMLFILLFRSFKSIKYVSGTFFFLAHELLDWFFFSWNNQCTQTSVCPASWCLSICWQRKKTKKQKKALKGLFYRLTD